MRYRLGLLFFVVFVERFYFCWNTVSTLKEEEKRSLQMMLNVCDQWPGEREKRVPLRSSKI